MLTIAGGIILAIIILWGAGFGFAFGGAAIESGNKGCGITIIIAVILILLWIIF